MIDNIKEARPHFGLGAADVIYEAPAEGGIPRLMPIFLRAGTDVGSIGPVRSARHYFVYLANEYRTPLVHIGASPQGFDALSATGPERRRRAARRRRLQARLESTSAAQRVRQHVVDSPGAQRTRRADPCLAWPTALWRVPAGPQPATSVQIAYPGGERYTVAYTYDPDTHLYERIMDGFPHKDGSTGDQYTASSIMIQFANVVPIPNDDAGRVDVALVGSGKGILIADGTQVPLQWSRASVRDATQFTRGDGAPFLLPSGQVWVQIVPLEAQVTVS